MYSTLNSLTEVKILKAEVKSLKKENKKIKEESDEALKTGLKMIVKLKDDNKILKEKIDNFVKWIEEFKKNLNLIDNFEVDVRKLGEL